MVTCWYIYYCFLTSCGSLKWFCHVGGRCIHTCVKDHFNKFIKNRQAKYGGAEGGEVGVRESWGGAG